MQKRVKDVTAWLASLRRCALTWKNLSLGTVTCSLRVATRLEEGGPWRIYHLPGQPHEAIQDAEFAHEMVSRGIGAPDSECHFDEQGQIIHAIHDGKPVDLAQQ